MDTARSTNTRRDTRTASTSREMSAAKMDAGMMFGIKARMELEQAAEQLEKRRQKEPPRDETQKRKNDVHRQKHSA